MTIDSIGNSDALIGVKSLDRSSIDLVLIDPPYAISQERKNNKMTRKGCQYKYKYCDLVKADWDKEIDFAIFPELYRVLKDGGTLLCFYDVWKLQSLRASLEDTGFHQFRLCEWVKANPMPVNSKHNYLSNAKEYFVCCRKRWGGTFHSEYDNGTYHCSLCHPPERIHPTQKPLKLIRELVEKHTEPDQLVLDCFMGSGTTAVACKQIGRHYIGFEINQEYVLMAQERLSKV